MPAAVAGSTGKRLLFMTRSFSVSPVHRPSRPFPKCALLDGEALPEYKTHPSRSHDSAVCSAFHRPRRRVVPPLCRTGPLSISIPLRIRFGSLQTAVLKASPAINFINTGKAKCAGLTSNTALAYIVHYALAATCRFLRGF
jgi:hypothetical protein